MNGCYRSENLSPTQLTSLINSAAANSLTNDRAAEQSKLNQAVSIPVINYFSNGSNMPTCLTNSTSRISTNGRTVTCASPSQTSTILPANALNGTPNEMLNGTNNGTNGGLNGGTTGCQDSIELQLATGVSARHDPQHSKNESQFKSNLGACSGSCNQLIHGYYQQPAYYSKGQQQTLLNNNSVYSSLYSNNPNRNSFAAITGSTNGYLNHLNRFNLLRNSMRSTNELLHSGPVASPIYGQLTVASLRNSLAWSPIYWSSGMNGLVNGSNANGLNGLNNGQCNGLLVNGIQHNGNGTVSSHYGTLNGTLNGKLSNGSLKRSAFGQQQTKLPSPCNNKGNSSSSLNHQTNHQTNHQSEPADENKRTMTNYQQPTKTDSNHETNLDLDFHFSDSSVLLNGSKRDQSAEADKLSLYDNVDEDDCLQPLLEKSSLLEKSANLLRCEPNSTPASGHVRILDNYRDDIKHSLSLNKLCL